MRKNILIGLVSGSLLLVGCSQKNVEIDTKENLSKYASSSKSNDGSGYEFLEKLDTPKYNNIALDDSRLSDGNVLDNSQNSQFGTAKASGMVSVYFGYNEYTLNELFRSDVAKNAALIAKSLHKIRIEGNCDEWGSDEYNVALGLKRAKSVKDALIADGIPESKIITISLGESNPVCVEKNEECWQKNRRVDFVEVQ